MARSGPIAAALADADAAFEVLDDAYQWLASAVGEARPPLAAEVWVFDGRLERVLMVEHRWRGWVAPGGTVEPGETPREAAVREVAEETGVSVELLPMPAVVTVRSYKPGWEPTFGVSYAAIADLSVPLIPENGQEVAWLPLDQEWSGWFAADRERMRRYAAWIATPHVIV